MQGIFILFISFIILFLISKFTNLKPLINYNNNFEYLPIFTANLYADLLIIFVTFSNLLGKHKSWDILAKWYKKYRLSAMMADILIGVIYLLIARFIIYKINYSPSLFEFGIIAVIIQIVLDFMFYLLFSFIPKGANNMLDLFKEWGKYAKLDALWGDSVLIIVGVVLSSLLINYSFNINMLIMLIGLYLTPYIIHMKD